jgi:hypothetical protein
MGSRGYCDRRAGMKRVDDKSGAELGDVAGRLVLANILSCRRPKRLGVAAVFRSPLFSSDLGRAAARRGRPIDRYEAGRVHTAHCRGACRESLPLA